MRRWRWRTRRSRKRRRAHEDALQLGVLPGALDEKIGRRTLAGLIEPGWKFSISPHFCIDARSTPRQHHKCDVHEHIRCGYAASGFPPNRRLKVSIATLPPNRRRKGVLTGSLSFEHSTETAIKFLVPDFHRQRLVRDARSKSIHGLGPAGFAAPSS